MIANNLGTIIPNMMQDCTILDPQTVNTTDGMFGVKTIYVPGAKFRALLRKDNSPEMRVAEAQGVRERYTVGVEKGLKLQYGQVFQRDADGAVFRIVSNIVDSEAPEESTVQIGAVTAEKWVLPT